MLLSKNDTLYKITNKTNKYILINYDKLIQSEYFKALIKWNKINIIELNENIDLDLLILCFSDNFKLDEYVNLFNLMMEFLFLDDKIKLYLNNIVKLFI